MLTDLLSEFHTAEFDEPGERTANTLTGVDVCLPRDRMFASRDTSDPSQLTDSVLDLPMAKPSRGAVDGTAVRINGEWSWVYAATDLDSKLVLGVAAFG